MDEGVWVLYAIVCGGAVLVLGLGIGQGLVLRAIRKRRRDQDLEALRGVIREELELGRRDNDH